jgi:hypothetical protein
MSFSKMAAKSKGPRRHLAEKVTLFNVILNPPIDGQA